jgi:hypothetical protein
MISRDRLPLERIAMKLTVKPLMLLSFIFLMAGVYELIWMKRPDYFRVQAGVNSLPVDLVTIARDYSAYSDKSKPLPQILPDKAEDDAVVRIKDIYRQFQLKSVSLKEKQDKYAITLREMSSDSKAFYDSQWLQYQQYVDGKRSQFDSKINTAKERMQSILRDSGVTTPDRLSVQDVTKYGKLRIELANIEVEQAKAEYDARTYGLSHLTEFQEKVSQQSYLEHNKELDSLRKSIFADQLATDRLHGDIYDAFVDYRKAIAPRLGYSDFLYFSVGAATTATFGDISPNATPVRSLVCVQVLVSIILSGLFVSQLASKTR